jgi:ribosome-binding factor A
MREFPRTARLNHLIHEIVAEEIERLDDDRLGFLTVVAVEVTGDLRQATVWYSSLAAAGVAGEPTGVNDGAESAEVAEALEEARREIQAAIARQARLKRTPELVFRPDQVLREAERVESILRDLGGR